MCVNRGEGLGLLSMPVPTLLRLFIPLSCSPTSLSLSVCLFCAGTFSFSLSVPSVCHSPAPECSICHSSSEIFIRSLSSLILSFQYIFLLSFSGPERKFNPCLRETDLTHTSHSERLLKLISCVFMKHYVLKYSLRTLPLLHPLILRRIERKSEKEKGASCIGTRAAYSTQYWHSFTAALFKGNMKSTCTLFTYCAQIISARQSKYKRKC